MTPFGTYLTTLRIHRRVKQKDLAAALRVNPSYISSIESGKKGPPAKHVIEGIIKILGLKKDEQSMLWNYARQSVRTFRIPDDLTEEQYAIHYDFQDSLGSLTNGQISLIRSILSMKIYESSEAEAKA